MDGHILVVLIPFCLHKSSVLGTDWHVLASSRSVNVCTYVSAEDYRGCYDSDVPAGG